MRGIAYDSLSLGHFGYIYGEEAKSILKESESIFKKYEEIIQQYPDRLNDLNFLKNVLIKATNAVIPDFPLFSNQLKIMLGVLNLFRKVLLKPAITTGDVLFPKYLKHLIDGYKNQKIDFNSD